jgi:3D (Asp-Asp-Asp) domain-containing protein
MNSLTKWLLIASGIVSAFYTGFYIVEAHEREEAGRIIVQDVQDRYKHLEEPLITVIHEPWIEPEQEPTPEPEQPTEPQGRKLSMVATAYTISKEQTGNTKGKTKSGTVVQKQRTLSVDPKVIPIGSVVYIESPSDLVQGYYVAEDTGSAIKGNKLDVFMGWGGRGTPDWNDAMDFGRKTVTVTIVREGKGYVDGI